MLSPRKNYISVIKIIILSALLEGISFYLQHNIDINLADEGYLLAGVVSTVSGKVPIRDFYSYDPGRYYWMAAWSLLFGEGLTAMRFYLAVFGAIGVSFGLLAARRVIRSFWGLVPLGTLLTIWIFPRFHSFDNAIAMSIVFFATRLIEKPTPWRYFAAGLLVGLFAFFGKNHGLYAFLAMTSAVMFIWLRIERGLLLKRYCIFIGGIFIGYSPLFVMAVFVPGFFHAFLDSILFFFRVGSTNIPLPVPWPWHVFQTAENVQTFYHDFFLGMLFLVMLLFYLLCLIKLYLSKKEDLRQYAFFTASLLTGIFYMHYVFSRADIAHLARGMHPLILTMVAFACLHKGGWSRRALIGIITVFLIISSYYTIVQAKPFYKKNFTQQDLYIEYPIRGEKIWITRGQAVMINTIERIVGRLVAPDEDVFLAPHIPNMYYILDRESPTWNSFFLYRRTRKEQQQVIDELEEDNVQWAVVGDASLDGRDDLRFSRTNDMVWRYLQRNYVLVDP